ncbi:MAG: ABC transporter permease [Methylophilaceae bacterium]
MFFLKLILRNIFRHKLRSSLTMLGIVVAILSFGLLRTMVSAWYAGVEATSSTRLITRNAISLVVPLPTYYAQKIRQVEGVSTVAGMNWFAGIYIDRKNFFPQFAVDPAPFLQLYPEYLLTDAEKRDFLHDRQACLVGEKIAKTYGWKLGDVIPLQGTIFPGNWSFVVRGIYRGADNKTDTSQLFFHWDALNEKLKITTPRRANNIGVFAIGVNNSERAAEISQSIDALFKNSLSETLTETEKAFQLSFVSMTETILIAVQIVSFLVIFIIMAVMANTMAMTARERSPEYATLKALGFAPSKVAVLIFGESLAMALIGGGIGIALTYPAAAFIGDKLASVFPIFIVPPEVVTMGFMSALLVGLVAGLLPALRVMQQKITDGLKSIA